MRSRNILDDQCVVDLIAKYSSDIVIRIASDFSIKFLNQAAIDFFNLSLKDVFGESWFELSKVIGVKNFVSKDYFNNPVF